MSERQKFFRYTKVAHRALDWGTEAPDIQTVMKRFGTSVSLGDMALLAILDRLNLIVNSIADTEINRRLNILHEHGDVLFKQQIDYTEDTHGPCPGKLKDYLKLEFVKTMRANALGWNGLREKVNGWVSPPPKGTEMRREYNRWMRRKPKKESRTDD